MDVLSASVVSDWTVTVVLATTLAALAAFFLPRRNDLPPGPWGVPLLGYLPFLGNKPFIALARLAKKYGPVFSVRLGTRLVIILGDFDVIKESFVMMAKHFSDRPENNPFSEVINYHFVGYYGPDWIILSKFLNKCFKELGTGTAIVEAQILDEIDIFLSILKCKVSKAGGKSVIFRRELAASAANNACILTFGKRFDYRDTTFNSLKENEDSLTPLYDSINWRFLFPFLTRIPGFKSNPTQSLLREKGDKFRKFAKAIIQDHVTNPQKYRDRDFIFSFLQEQNNRRSAQIPLAAFDDEHFHGILMALFGGGAQTVEVTVSWAIVFMLHHPQLQERIHQELDGAIGRDKRVAYADRQRTPLAEATLMEVERFVSIATINVPHGNTEEVTLRGYTIPKGSYILANLWGVHHDPTRWTNPDRFNPERFIEGGKAVRFESLIPFSVGKRACPGESLAKMELYLYFVTMLQHFQILPVEGAPLPPLPLEIKYPGLVYRCPEYPVQLVPRF